MSEVVGGPSPLPQRALEGLKQHKVEAVLGSGVVILAAIGAIGLLGHFGILSHVGSLSQPSIAYGASGGALGLTLGTAAYNRLKQREVNKARSLFPSEGVKEVYKKFYVALTEVRFAGLPTEIEKQPAFKDFLNQVDRPTKADVENALVASFEDTHKFSIISFRIAEGPLEKITFINGKKN